MKSDSAVLGYLDLRSIFNLTLPNARDVLIDCHSLPDFFKNSPKTINQIKIIYTYVWQSQVRMFDFAKCELCCNKSYLGIFSISLRILRRQNQKPNKYILHL